ncbi:BnaA09g42040D-like protein [Cocos nucifera]|uniref:BnaA09g42040D-like protein n=1 Tax=Cocos nucifera TaxID=13894 RepID=A0A8K0INV6_COCNU|nr:BnaA09g42040D-like protein [Cocos nucifera]
MALLLLASACPYVLPDRAAKPLQNGLIAIAFPLVGVSAALDALLNLAGGIVNIHVLMALAAFASVFMGNSLEGALLLAMFNLAHIAEEYFTSRSMIDVKELKDNHPDFALLLEVNGDRPPQFSKLNYTKIPVHDLKVGSYILVRAGEAVPVDGEVFQGSSTITIEHLTGETKPLERIVGDSIPGGARNLEGMMIVKGILLKGGHVLDALAACQSIAFDKTGTLTTGKLMCKAIEPIHGHLGGRRRYEVPSCCIPNCESEALAVAAAMEKGTTHPIGRAVVDHSLGKDLPDISVESFESVPGRGLFATLTGIKVTLFHFEDEPRPGVAEVISTLKDQGKLRIMMLTGDHESSARRVANTVGIDEVHCCLKPEDKLNKVKSASRDRGGGLIMVGDGINDAPALAAATVGIVLAQRASATAIAVADVLLLQDNISGVPFVIAKARQTTSLVKQSVALALTCIIFASLPSVLGFVPLWLTVLLHEGGTLLVCLNSIRALNNPTWSWLQDLQQLADGLRKAVADLLNKRPPRSH